MSRSASIHFSLYALLMGTGALVAVAASVLALSEDSLSWPDTAVFAFFAVSGAALAFAVRPTSTLSLDIAYLLAAAYLFPAPVSVVIAVAAAGVSTLLRHRHPRASLLASFGASAGTLTAMAGAGTIAFSRLRPVLSTLDDLSAPAFFLVGFVCLVAVLAALETCATAMLGQPALPALRRYVLRILPLDLLAVPLALLLSNAFQAGGRLVFLLLAVLTILTGLLMERLENARAAAATAGRDLKKRLDELQVVSAIGRDLATSLTPERVFEVLARGCRKIFGFDFYLVALFDPDTRESRFELVRDSSGAARSHPALGSPQLVVGILSQDRPLLAGDVRRNGVPEPLRPALLTPAVRSMMATPLFVEGKVAGMLCLQSLTVGAYDEHALSVLTTVGQQAAISLENARNYERAIRDELTGLFQREYFFQRLQDESLRSGRYGSPFAVLMLDVDGFKAMNDRYGHLAGDRYLRALGDVIRESLRGADVPCRYGGEEFAVMLPETDLAGARVIAERIREAAASLELKEHGTDLRTTVSIGVAVHGEGSAPTPEALVLRADHALYEAKRTGKNRVVSAPVAA